MTTLMRVSNHWGGALFRNIGRVCGPGLVEEQLGLVNTSLESERTLRLRAFLCVQVSCGLLIDAPLGLNSHDARMRFGTITLQESSAAEGGKRLGWCHSACHFDNSSAEHPHIAPSHLDVARAQIAYLFITTG